MKAGIFVIGIPKISAAAKKIGIDAAVIVSVSGAFSEYHSVLANAGGVTVALNNIAVKSNKNTDLVSFIS